MYLFEIWGMVVSNEDVKMCLKGLVEFSDAEIGNKKVI